MMGRFARRTLTLVLSLAGSLGCTSWPNVMPTLMMPPQQPAISNLPVGELPNAQVDQPAGELSNVQAAQLCFTAGEALEKKGFTAEAIRQYESARQQDPRLPNVSHRLAVLSDLQGDAVRAEKEYGLALQEQPRNVELLNNVGYFHYGHGRLQTAENWLRNAVTVDPGYAPAWVNLGQVLARQGRVEESYQAFAHALRPAEAYSNLGVLLAKQGRTREARNALQQAIALDPSLEQPKAFLKALASSPSSPPPVHLIRSAPKAQAPVLAAAPAPKASQVTMKPALQAPPPRVSASRTTPAPVRPALSPRSSLPATVSASPTTPALYSQPQSLMQIPSAPVPARTATAPADGPIIIHGPIQPRPVLTQPARVEVRPKPAMPPLPPPPPPPLSLHPAASTGGSGLLRTSASFASADTKLSPTKAASIHLLPVPNKPAPTPAAEPQAVLTDCVTPNRRRPVSVPAAAPPRVVLTDCQGEAPADKD